MKGKKEEKRQKKKTQKKKAQTRISPTIFRRQAGSSTVCSHIGLWSERLETSSLVKRMRRKGTIPLGGFPSVYHQPVLKGEFSIS